MNVQCYVILRITIFPSYLVILIKTSHAEDYRISKEQHIRYKRISQCSAYHTMGVCVSCRRSGKDDAVEDISEEIDSDYSDDDYVERITHITADIHEMIRRKDHTKVGTKHKFKNLRIVLAAGWQESDSSDHRSS